MLFISFSLLRMSVDYFTKFDEILLFILNQVRNWVSLQQCVQFALERQTRSYLAAERRFVAYADRKSGQIAALCVTTPTLGAMATT